MVPLCDGVCDCDVSIHSLSTRSAINAAAALRCPTWPARFAMRSPSTATGMTMAMNARAASTSASVNAPRARLAAGLTGLNFIMHATGTLRDPHRVIGAFANHNPIRTGFADEPIRRKADGREVNGTANVLAH